MLFFIFQGIVDTCYSWNKCTKWTCFCCKLTQVTFTYTVQFFAWLWNPLKIPYLKYIFIYFMFSCPMIACCDMNMATCCVCVCACVSSLVTRMRYSAFAKRDLKGWKQVSFVARWCATKHSLLNSGDCWEFWLVPAYCVMCAIIHYFFVQVYELWKMCNGLKKTCFVSLCFLFFSLSVTSLS